MRRSGLLFLIIAVLIVPMLSMGLTGCGTKAVKTQTGPGQTDTALTEAQIREAKMREARQVFENEFIHFDFDKYNIRPDAQQILADKAQYMQEYSEVQVLISGHCDNRGTEEYNYALGDRRAKSAKRWLEGLGISGMRMSTISYGEERPLPNAMSNNEYDWALNRRCEFQIQ